MSPDPILHLESWVPTLLSLVIRPVAVTLGRHVFIRRGVTPTDVLLRHEAVHVAQAAELGLIRFLFIYLADWVRVCWALRDVAAAYRAIRFEQEARALEHLAVPWAQIGEHRAERGWALFALPGRP